MRLFDQLYLGLGDQINNLNLRLQALSLGLQFPKKDFPIHVSVLDGYFHEMDLRDECLRASIKNALHDFDTSR